ncbi:chemotaxis protein CheW [Geobacter pelophilus]|uniref:Chemotaxis protein CheW n=1 Tax=Geoanaerobacter pelophilus TaxID=60036 RepID=A0AAW4LA07_9BACT|nr:chemotaxis protein CheW [Geoanaerobacter pelophilus]MBT0664016.1 chemotaxis protein CheW [Geoanaerobacter pelophilus]
MAGDADRLVLFSMSGQKMAIDLATVTEVVELPETWPIPLAPSFFKGVMNFHGALIPLLDLGCYLGPGATGVAGKALVLDRSIADLALWVEDVERVLPSADAALVGGGESPTVAVLEIAGNEVLLISAEALIDKLETDLLTMQRTFTGLEETA